MPVHEPGSGQDTKSVCTLISGLQTVQNTLMFKPPSLWYFYQSSRTKPRQTSSEWWLTLHMLLVQPLQKTACQFLRS